MAAGTIKVVLDGMCKNCDLFDPTFECVHISDFSEESLNNLENITCSHKDCCERAYLIGKMDTHNLIWKMKKEDLT